MNLALIDPDGFPGIKDYFEQAPIETVHTALAKTATFEVGNQIRDRTLSLQGIGNYVTENCEEGDSLVIVSHGNNEQILIPLGVGSRAGLNYANVRKLNECLDNPNCDYKVAAGQLGFTSTVQFEKLMSYFFILRLLKLNHVGFRACRAGNDMGLVIELSKLFNCRTISVPMLRDFFTKTTMKFINTKQMDEIQKTRPNLYYFGEKPYRVVIDYLISGSSGKIWFNAELGSEELKTRTSKAVDQFLAAKFKFSKPDQIRRKDDLFLHGLFLEGKAPYFYFPSDPGYNNNLRTWSNEPFIPDMYIPKEQDRDGIRRLIDNVRERRVQRQMRRAARQ